jgi:hypothetical protein
MKKILLKIGLLIVFIVTTLNFVIVPCKKTTNSEVSVINAYKYINRVCEIGVIKINKNKMNYSVKNQNHKNFNFYVNANYFGKTPIGEVKIDNKVVNKKNKNGGFFTTDGKTPKFYFNSRPNNVKFSSQTHTVGIINGNVNNRILNQGWAKVKVHRLMIGEDINGNIIVIHSRNLGFLTVSEICEIGKKLGVYNGLIFDGGTSVEIGLKDGDINYSYQSIGDLTRKLFNVPTPSVFIVGNFK